MTRSPRPSALLQQALSPTQVAQLQGVQRALDDRDRVAGGCAPSAEELADAPTLTGWRWSRHVQFGLPSLAGVVLDHPRLGSGPASTAPLSTLRFLDGRGWARSWSRWYQLGPRDRGNGMMDEYLDPDDRAEFFSSDVQSEPVIRAFELSYWAPDWRLEPDVGDEPDVPRLREGWAVPRYGADADRALAVWIALRNGTTTREARAALRNASPSMERR